jgi:hypothetical protein
VEGVSALRLDRFTPGKRPGTLHTRGWVGPRAGLDEYGKSRPPPGFEPRTVQPVASRYTDCAILAHELESVCLVNAALRGVAVC